MREPSFLRRVRFASFARGAARTAAVLATLGLRSAGSASAATTFQAGYIYGTSGPAGGGTAVNVVGNQFAPGATVTFGGQTASATVTNSTRISATSPSLNPGAVYDVIVTNPGDPPGVLTRGWFADFTDVPQASPFTLPSRRSSATASRPAAAAATTARPRP
jgi:hypothetical protein